MSWFAKHLERSVIPEPNSGCLLWTGWVNCNGYGRVKSPAGVMLAHRASWEHHHGPIPTGLLVCHKCDVRICVNPDHLFLGTRFDNMRDMVAKGRNVVNRATAKLNEESVRQILRDNRTHSDIARSYGVAQSTISMIKARRNWAHVAT